MTGKLFLCGTPIGNLEDITERAKRILSEVDLIAAEDTRQTLKLLNHFDIKKELVSYHEHNKIERGPKLIESLKAGLNIALVTDAGMPGISDPGEDLVRLCIDEGIGVEVIPGPTASITALVISGFPTRRFIFEGFLPKGGKERRKIIEELKNETRTVIVYEAPHRINATLKELYECLGDREIAICRELTKKFEEVIRTGLKDASRIYDDREPKGEFVIVIKGKSVEDIEKQNQKVWENISVDDHINMYISKGMNKKDAMKKVAKDRGVSKRDIYKQQLTSRDN
ncbi:MAG TPA: 16S rRNA (cytidine(1402)-2'-O)-methyltransferase [Clostridiaceae bacterium]|nr:16S rRNA (cytidine(1402)-2'-O)-methyltransferase [Clostridiaceae bacterium]